jgi:hypothetical protein
MNSCHRYYIREKIEVLCTILGDDSADKKETGERKGKKILALLESEFLTFKEPKNRFQEISFASLYNPVDRNDNPIPTVLGS